MDEEIAQITSSRSHPTHGIKCESLHGDAFQGQDFIKSIFPLWNSTFSSQQFVRQPAAAERMLHKNWVLIQVNLSPPSRAKINWSIHSFGCSLLIYKLGDLN